MLSNQTKTPYGKEKLSIVDHFGVFLSLLAIKKNLPRRNDLHMVDLGCGYHAKLLISLHDRISKGIGIDYSVNPLLIKKRTNLHFIESPIESGIQQVKDSAHVITMISVLEHLTEPNKILKTCFDLLSEEGILLINVPTWKGKFFLELSAFKFGTSPKSAVDDHKMYYDKRDIWPMLIKAGFKPSQVSLKYHKFGLNLFVVAKKSC